MLGLAGEEEVLHLVVGLLDRALDLAQPGLLGAGQVLLAVALEEVDDALALAGDADQPVGELLLLDVGDLLFLELARLGRGLQDDGAVGLDPEALGEHRVAVGIDDLPGELPFRAGRVLLEQVLGRPLAGVGSGEGRGLDRHRQLAHNLDGLGRQAVAAVLGQVHPPVVAGGHDLDQRDHAEDQDDHDQRVEPVPGGPAAPDRARVGRSSRTGRTATAGRRRSAPPARPRPTRAGTSTGDPRRPCPPGRGTARGSRTAASQLIGLSLSSASTRASAGSGTGSG